jgi:hypothetical protein
VRFQEVARATDRVIRIAYGTALGLLRLLLNRRRLVLASVAPIAAVVASAADEDGQQR